MTPISMQQPGDMNCACHAIVNMSRWFPDDAEPLTLEQVAEAAGKMASLGSGMRLDEGAEALVKLGWIAAIVTCPPDGSPAKLIRQLLKNGGWGVVASHNFLNETILHSVHVWGGHSGNLRADCSIQGDAWLPLTSRSRAPQGISHKILIARPAEGEGTR